MRKLYQISIALLLASCSEQNNKQKPESDTAQPLQDSSSQNDGSKGTFPDGDYFFSGRIDHKYPFHMQFSVASSKVTGFYFYNNMRKEISLTGYIDSNALELDESFNQKITGHFISSILTPDSIAGSWSNPKGKKMDFVLYQSSKKDYELALAGTRQIWTKDQFYALVRKFDQAVFPHKYSPLPLDEEKNQEKAFTEEEMKLFINPEYDPNSFIHPRYYYGLTYEAPDFIAIIFTEHYVPGAFGIYNSSLIMRTFTKDGKPIDEKYLGCNCYDNNMDDYYETSEEFLLNAHEITITGTETHATQDYAKEENPALEPFHIETKINRKVKILEDGTLK